MDRWCAQWPRGSGTADWGRRTGVAFQPLAGPKALEGRALLAVDLLADLWLNPGEIPGDGIDNDGNGFIDDVHGWDFVDAAAVPQDGFGHGTHVAEIIGAVGNNGTGVTGVNWQVSIMALRVQDDRGAGSTSAVIAALRYATMMRRDYVTGVVALLAAAKPGIGGAETRAAILGTATQLASLAGKVASGRLNAWAALASLGVEPTRPLATIPLSVPIPAPSSAPAASRRWWRPRGCRRAAACYSST